MSARIRSSKEELRELGEEEDEFTNSSSKLRDSIKNMTGFDIMKDENTYKDIYDILLGIGKQWDKLSDTSQAAVAEMLAGKRGANALFAILNNIEDLEDAYETAQGAAGSAQREQEAYAQSVQYSIDRAKASLEELANDFLSSDLLKGLIDAGNTALRIVDSLVQKLGSVGSIITALGGLSTIKGLLGADSVVGSLVKSVAEKYTGKNLGNSLLKNIGELFSSADFGKALGGFGKNVVDSIVGKEATEAVTDWTTDVVGAATSSITEVGSEVVGGLLTSTEKQFDVLSDSARNMSTEAAEAVSKTMGEWRENVVSDGISDEMWDTFIDGGSEAFDEVSDDFAKYVHDRAVGDAVKETLEEASEEAIGEGIEKGAKAATASAGKTVVKEMADDVGKGAADMYETVTRSAADFADDAFQFAGSAMSGASTAGAAAGESFMSALLGALNPATLAIAGTALATAVGIAISKELNDRIDKQRKEAVQAWESERASIDGYVASYKELYEKLDDKDLSEEQQIGIKQQLLDLQHQIVAQYGAEADGIDLVNGKLEQQLGIFDVVAEKEAAKNYAENKSIYDEAIDIMNQKVEEKAVGTPDVGRLDYESLQNIKTVFNELSDIEGVTASLKDYGDEGLQYEISINYDDVFEASENVAKLEDRLEQTIKQANDLGNTQVSEYLSDMYSMLFGYNGSNGQFGARVNATTEEYLAPAEAGAELQFYKEGGRRHINNLTDAVHEFNTAVREGDIDKLDDATNAVNNAKTALQDFAKEKGISETIVQNEITKQTSAMKQAEADSQYMQNMLSAAMNKNNTEIVDSNPYKDQAKQISEYVDTIQKADISTVDAQIAFDKGAKSLKDIGDAADAVDLDDTSKAVLGLANIFGYSLKEGKKFSEVLANTALVASEAGSTINDSAQSELPVNMKDRVSSYVNYVSSLNQAMNDARGATGLTIEEVEELTEAYKGIESFDPARLFEQTSMGVHLNRSELERLNEELESETLPKLMEDLGEKVREYQEVKAAGGDTSALENEINIAQSLISQYQGLTSAYNDWVNAKSRTKERTPLESFANSFETVKSIAEQGWLNDDEVTSWLDLALSKSRRSNDTLQDLEKVTQTIEGTEHSLMDYFTKDESGALTSEGISMFLEDVNKTLGDSYATIEDGNETLDLTGDKLETVAERFGTTTDMVMMLARAMPEGWFDVNLDTSLTEQISDAKQAVSDLQSQGVLSEGIKLDFDITTGSLDEAKAAIESLKKERAKIDVEVDPEGAEALDHLIDLSEQEYYIRLNYETNGSLDQAGIIINRIHELVAQAQSESPVITVKAAVEGSDEVQQLASELSELPEETQVAVGIDEGNIGDAEGILKQLSESPDSITIPVNYDTTSLEIAKDPVQVDVQLNYPEEKKYEDQKPKVEYQLHTPQYTYSDQHPSVIYSLQKPDPPSYENIHREIIYTIRTIGAPPSGKTDSMATGTMTTMSYAHADGTSYNVINYRDAFSNGKVSLSHDEIALVNEMGQESIIRDGKWMLLPPGMHQQALKKGDIILSARQTESLLRTGKAIGTGHAYAYGTLSNAHYNDVTAKQTQSNPWKNKKDSGGDTYNVDTYNNYESGSDSKKGGGDGGSGSDDSSSEDAKDKVKELFDWIEVKMERLTTRIKVAATTAGSAFESFADRLTANAKQIKTIKIKEEKNDEAVKEYKKASKKARKGLSKKYVKKVRNGTIDIEEIKNEKLKDKITKYQDAYKKYYDAKYVTPGELKQERLEAVSNRFDMVQSKYEGRIGKHDNTIEKYQKNQELREEKGLLPSIKNYKAQIKETDAKKKDLLAEQKALKNQLEKAIQDGIAKDSEKYREMEEAVEAVGIALKDADIDAQKLKNDINKAYLATFEKHNEEGESKTGDLEYEQKKIEDNDALRVAKGKNKSLSNNKALRKNAKDQVKTGKTILKQLRADYKNFLKGGGLPDSDEGKKMIAGIRSWEEEIRSDIQRYVDLGNEALDIVVDDLSDVQDNINFKRLMNDQGRQSRANKQSLREAKGLLPDLKSYKNDLKSNAVDRELDDQEAAALEDAMKKYLKEGGKPTDKAYRDMKEQRYDIRRKKEQSLIDDEETKKKIKDWYVDAYTKKSEKYENALSANEYRRKQLQNEQDIRVAKGELESRDNVKEQRALAVSDKKNKEKEIGILERLQRMYLQEEGHTVNDEQYKSLGKSIESLNIDVGDLDKSIIDFDNDLKRIDVEEHNRKIEDLDYNYDLKNHDLEMLQIEQSKRNAKDLLNSVNNFDAQREIINDMGRIIDEKIQTTIEDMKNYSGSTEDKEYKDFQKELNDLYEARSNNELELLENQNSIKQAYVDKFNRQADRFDANSAKFDHDINMLRARQERNNLLDKDEEPEIYNQMIDLTKQKIENEMTRIQKLRETLAEYLANGGSTEDDNYRSMSSGLYSAEEGLETLINSLYELGDAATNTAVQLFNKNKNKYDAQIEGLEFLNSIIDSRQESSDLNGGLPSAELYEQQRENLTKMIDLETQSFEQMKRDMENFIAMGGDTTSDEYMNMLSSLRQMGKSILDRTNELDELGKKIREIPVERLKKITDFYDFLISGNEHEKNTLENEQSLLTAKGELASVETYEKMIANDNEKLAILAKEREYIVQSMADYLASPGAKETDEEYRDMANQLNELDETAQQTEIDMANLNNEIRSVYTERFNKIAEDFGNQISLIEHKTNEINNTLSLIEARGHFATKSLYDSLVGGSIEQMDKLKAEFDELVIARDEAFESGKIEKYSSEWYAFQNALSDVNERYQEAYLNAVKFRKELEKLNWDKFDFLQNQISDISDEAQFMIDLLSHKDLFDKEGLITNEGMATIGLYTERYHILTEQLAEYADEIARLDNVIEENPGDKEYIERRQELVKARRDTILTIENEKDSIKSLVEDGIQKELDSLRELIDAYVDAMDSAKDLYDYQKRIKKQTDEIAKLRKRLAAYSGDTSEENKARVQKITVDLEEALDELEETQYEHYISEQKKMLDDLYDQYEKLLNDRLDDLDALLKDMLTMVDSNANQIAETIRAAAVDSKYGITSTINAVWGESIWNSGGEGETIISNISDVVAHGVQETISIVNDIFDSVNNDVLPALHALDKDPVINVEPAKVEVNIPEPDTSKFIDKLQEISDKVSLIVNDASNAKSAPKEEYSFSAHDDGYHAREDVDDKIVEEYVSEEQVASDDYVISLRQKLEEIRKEITGLQNKQWTQKDLTTNKAQTFSGIASLDRQLVSLLDEAVGNKELQSEISSLINALDSLRKNVTSQSQSYSAPQPGDIVEEYASSEQTASEAPAYSSQTSSITLNTYQVKTDPYGNGSRIDPSYYGHPVFVTDVRSNADYPYQVSSDPYGNNVIGWVRRMHLKGYAGGARLINSDQFAWTQENDPETIVRKSDHAVLTRLGRGDRIYNALASDRLWTAANDPMKYLTDAVGMSGRVNMEPTTGTSVGDVVYNITIPIEHVQDYNDFVNQLRSDGKFEKMVQSMTIDRIAGKSRLAKNKYQW